MSRLTRAEKNAIIINDSKGIQHPDYYVCKTKTGGIQVRKRKESLNTTQTTTTATTAATTTITDITPKTDTVTDTVTAIKDSNNNSSDAYESITNKQLLEKMLDILEKNVVSNDKNKNDVERERETQDNKAFVENIKDQAHVATNAKVNVLHKKKGRSLFN